MAPFGISNRTSKRQGTYANQIQQGRVGGYHRGLNALTRLTPSSSGVGGGGFSSVPGTKGSSLNSGSRNNIPRNVPKPLQTSSLKKENGGQDVTAVLVNRRNGSGKKVGWGSALPPTPDPPPPPPQASASSAEPTPAEIADSENIYQTQVENSHDGKTHEQSLPTSNNQQSALDRDVPWALHPPPEEALKQHVNKGSYHNSYAEEPFARPPRERQIHENSINPPHDHPDDRYKNYRPNFRDRNSSQMYRGGNDYFERNQYEPFARKPSDDYSREREIRPFARRPVEYNRGHSGYDNHNRDYNRDFDHRGGHEYRDHRDNRSVYNHRRNDFYQPRYHDPRDNRGFSYDREIPRRFNDRYDNNQFSNANEYGHEFDRRHVPFSKHEQSYDVNSRYDSIRPFPIDHTNDSKTDNDSRRHSIGNVNETNETPHILNNVDTRHQPPAKSEEDIIMQSIKDREAAEVRARAKELQTTGDIEFNEDNQVKDNETLQTVRDTETIENITNNPPRNKNQVGGEASGNTMQLEYDQSHSELKTEVSIREETAKILKRNTLDLVESRDTNNAPEEDNIKNETIRDGEKMESIDKTGEDDLKLNNLKDDDVPVVSQEEEGNLTEAEKESRRKTRAMKQQQKILEKVAAARKNSRKAKKATLKVIIEPQEASMKVLPERLDRIDNEEELAENQKNEKEYAEAEAKTARTEYSKSRGPRTKGVLFRRLPDGSLVNADLTEEQLQKREAKKLARMKKIQEKMEKREKKKLQAKLKKKEKKDKYISSESSEEMNEIDEQESNNASRSKKKTYTPAPPPPVSAWKAGPPSGFKVQPTFESVIESNTNSDLDQSLFPDGVDGLPSAKRAEKSRIEFYTKFKDSQISSHSENPLDHNDVANSQSIDIEPSFSSQSALNMSVTQEMATWNAFGPSPSTNVALDISSLGLSQSNIMPTSTSNWTVSQAYASPSTSAVLNIWSHEHIPSTTIDDKDLAMKGAESAQELSSNTSPTENLGVEKLTENYNPSSNDNEKPRNKSKKFGRRNLKHRGDKRVHSKPVSSKREKRNSAKVHGMPKKDTKTEDNIVNAFDAVNSEDQGNDDVLHESNKPAAIKRQHHLKHKKKGSGYSRKTHPYKKKMDESSETPGKSTLKKKTKRPIRRHKVSPLSREEMPNKE